MARKPRLKQDHAVIDLVGIQSSLLVRYLVPYKKGEFMAITASVARAQLFPLIEQVNEDMKPVLITSKAGNAVLISESEYESMIETQYLLSTPANREWILKSIAEADRGQTVKMDFPIILDKVKKKKVAPLATKAKSPR